MAYTPSEWSCGDIVTADKLNNIERGIAEVNSEYVPTSWQCGDLITAEAMNKIEQGIADAGGGSSDLSTATLSIVDEGGYRVNLKFATLNERGFSSGGYPEWISTDNLSVILYKGAALLELENLDSANISISGAIENVGGNTYAITGDCTITINKHSQG